MPEFLPLKDLRDRVWPQAMTRKLATDMTGVSLPILDFHAWGSSKSCQALFMLYYAVPGVNELDKITRPYALVWLDMDDGDWVKSDVVRTGEMDNPLVGSGVSEEIYNLPDNDRKNLQDLFFARCDEAARIYAGEKILPGQAGHLADLVKLFKILSEPPLLHDYEEYGKSFFTWLREHSKNAEKE